MKRLLQLDLIRAVAILLVLARHSDFGGIFYLVGWIGVDLFFVLSGFLIARLMFIEYKKQQRIRPFRFLLRRGFKIYPSFYVFMAVFFIVGISCLDRTFILNKNFWAELTFTQNIFGGIHFHTWSLGIEEQFYVFVAFFFFLTFNLFRWRPQVVLVFSILVILAFSILRIYLAPKENVSLFLSSFYRIDAFFYGIIVAWLLEFTKLNMLIAKKRWLNMFIFLVLVLLIPLFTGYDDILELRLYGFTCTYLAFFIVLLYACILFPGEWIASHPIVHLPLKVIGLIGLCSYNIYLWHLFVKELLEKYLHTDKVLFVIVYSCLSVLIGIAATYLIEKPFLRLRDRWIR